MPYIERTRLAHDILGPLIVKETRRALDYTSTVLDKVGQPQAAADCRRLALAETYTDEDAALLFIQQEAMFATILHITPEYAEEHPGPEIENGRRLKQGADMLFITARLVHQCAGMKTVGPFVTNIKSLLSALPILAEFAQVAKLLELNGGICPCGCCFEGPKTDFTAIKEQADAAMHEEEVFQDQEIDKALAGRPEDKDNDRWISGIKPFLSDERAKWHREQSGMPDISELLAAL